ncbi:MAG TPA: 4Fe-4S binding protein [Holophaga sp.]|nr:4Fe-4S binding protein [Holophaga sp.]
MERQIIRIDEERCDGCGLCVQGCPEGALQLIDGKARLVSEITCDGLGACIGDCPQGAITVETREAAPYDERATVDNILPLGANTLKAHLKHLHEHGQTTYLNQAIAYLQELNVSIPPYKEPSMHHACPGSAPRDFSRPAADPVDRDGLQSQLTQWPVQLHLISPMNPVFQGADLLLAADCCAFSLPDFNQRWLPGKKLAIACPKLDRDQEIYMDKLVALIAEAQINTLTVMIMEVPCCGGLLRMAQAAVERSGRKVPIKVIVVGVQGDVKQEAWV